MGFQDIVLSSGVRTPFGDFGKSLPYLAHKVRWGAQRGPFEFVDGLDFIYRCPFTRELMGDTAMHHVSDTGGRYAVISMCLGSGMGMDTLIENLVR